MHSGSNNARVGRRYEHILLGGFHIEEQIYGPRFYYPPERLNNPVRQYETSFPHDTTLHHTHHGVAIAHPPAPARVRLGTSQLSPSMYQAGYLQRETEAQRPNCSNATAFAARPVALPSSPPP